MLITQRVNIRSTNTKSRSKPIQVIKFMTGEKKTWLIVISFNEYAVLLTAAHSVQWHVLYNTHYTILWPLYLKMLDISLNLMSFKWITYRYLWWTPNEFGDLLHYQKSQKRKHMHIITRHTTRKHCSIIHYRYVTVKYHLTICLIIGIATFFTPTSTVTQLNKSDICLRQEQRTLAIW